MNPRAVLYIRFSTPGQRQGDSERRQRAAAQAYAETHGLVLDVRIDEGLSGYHGDHVLRGQLGAFVRDLQSGVLPPGTQLLVEDLSRFSRQSPMKALALLATIVDAGGSLIDVSDGQIYHADNMDMVRTLLFVVRQGGGHEDSRQKVTRATKRWKKKKGEEAAAGVPITRKTPYGITVVGASTNPRHTTMGCHYQIVEHEAEVVRHIWALAADGYSEHAIVRQMNRTSLHPPRGRTWAKSTIARFLREDRYIGTYQPYKGTNIKGHKRVPDGPPVPDVFPRLIDDETFNRARAHMATRATGRVVTHASGQSNLFTGLMYCTCTCGLIPVDKSSRNHPEKAGRVRMVCRAMKERHTRDGGPVHTSYKGIVRNDLEATVLLAIKGRVDVDVLLAARGEDAGAVQARLAALRHQVAAEDDRLRGMVRGLFGVPEGPTKVDMIRMVDEVRVQVDDLRRQLADAEAHAAKASTVRLDLVEVVREADILIDWLTGAGLPLEIAGPVLDVQQVLAAADALAASMDLGRARVKLKSMLREIVARIDVDLYEEKFTIYLRDGQTIRGTVYEVPGDPILRVLDPVGVDKGEYAGWVRLKVAE